MGPVRPQAVPSPRLARDWADVRVTPARYQFYDTSWHNRLRLDRTTDRYFAAIGGGK